MLKTIKKNKELTKIQNLHTMIKHYSLRIYNAYEKKDYKKVDILNKMLKNLLKTKDDIEQKISESIDYCSYGLYNVYQNKK